MNGARDRGTVHVDMFRQPWDAITPHLLRNRTSFANSYALLSESGSAILIDFGYDVSTGLVPSTERTARRPLLWSLDVLRRQHGVERIEAVVATHYHDDHVAGMNLLREVNAGGTTVLVATHDRELIRLVGRRTVTLDQGRIVEIA